MSPDNENDKKNWTGKNQQISNKVTAKLLKLQAAKLHHIVAAVETIHFLFSSIVFKTLTKYFLKDTVKRKSLQTLT